MGAKLYWTKEMTPDGISNPQEQIKRTRSEAVNTGKAIYTCWPSLHFFKSKII